MKKTTLFLLLAATTMLSSCRKIDEKTQFEMEYNTEVVIPASSSVNLPFNLMSPDVETNSEATFAVNDTRKDKIEEIILLDLDLELTSPAGEDFSFLKTIEIYISADGLPEVMIAWEDPVSPNIGNRIDLDVSDQDLKEYIKKDQFDLRVRTVTDEALAQDHHVEVQSLFYVDAKVLGQ